jgi:hypothetical protein
LLFVFKLFGHQLYKSTDFITYKMNAHEKATQRRIQGIHDAVIEGVECPQRERSGDVFYCRHEVLAREAECPYLSSEKAAVCIDKPTQEIEDYILKKTDVKPADPTATVPSHMEEKCVCEYVPVE